MRTLTVIALGLALCAPLAHAQDKQKAPKPQKIAVWVSDDKCGAKGADPGHAGCAKTCVGNGAAIIVITNDKKHTIYKVDNQDAVKNHVGELVKVTGTVTGDTVHVDKVDAMKQPKPSTPKS